MAFYSLFKPATPPLKSCLQILGGILILLYVILFIYDKSTTLRDKSGTVVTARKPFTDGFDSIGHLSQGFLGSLFLFYPWEVYPWVNRCFIQNTGIMLLLIYPIYDFGKSRVFAEKDTSIDQNLNTFLKLKSTNFYAAIDELLAGIALGLVVSITVHVGMRRMVGKQKLF